MVLDKIDDFEELAFRIYYGSSNGIISSKALNEKRFKVAEANSRLLNHWESEGVIIDNRTDGRGWRKFSAIDLVWMQIVLYMREFNISLGTLKTIRENLMSKEVFGKGSEFSTMPMLELYVRQTLVSPKNFEFVFTPEGLVDLGTLEEVQRTIKGGHHPNLIRIDLTSIVQKVSNKKLHELSKKVASLSDSEFELLQLIRSGKYVELNLKTSDGTIKQIKARELISGQSNLNALMKDHEFQDIQFTVRHGKKAGLSRTRSIKY